MNRVFLLLGGNQGNVSETFERAKQLIARKAGYVVAESFLYQSEPWGFTSDNLFLNRVIEVETQLEPLELLEVLLKIETKLGRTREPGVMASRPIDIDILFFNDQVIINQQLKVPHPRLHLRRFTLEPLAEIAPGLLHPLFAKTTVQLLEECNDPLAVTKLDTAAKPAC